jgi:signal transduction histidine kinase
MRSMPKALSSRGQRLRAPGIKGTAHEATATAQVGARDPEGGPRILIVDDEPASVIILERMLQRAGSYQIASTTDPIAGLDLVDSFAPDLVLLDLHMPRLDGYEFVQHIPEHNGKRLAPKVIILTADAASEVRERALALGAADFLLKPFDYLEVTLRIRNHLETHRLQVDLRRRNDDLEQRVAERTANLRTTLDRLRQEHNARRELLARLINAQEEERRRIAAEIHDDTIQTAVAVGMRLEMLARRLAKPEDQAEVERLRELVGSGLTGLRNLLIDLRPMALEHSGLREALRECAERWTTDDGPTVDLEAATEDPPLQTRTILFRIAQEALVNACKHAQASTVQITVERSDDGFGVTVQDDGRGFDPKAAETDLHGHLGLSSIHERAEQAGGWSRVESVPGVGTTVRAWIPVSEDEEVSRVESPPAGSAA